MGIRYCMHCGMPVPRRAKICPECGRSLKMRAPQNAPEPRVLPERPAAKGRTPRGKQPADKKASCFALGLIALLCTAALIIINAGDRIENARSRRREKKTDTQHNTATTRREIKIPEIIMPDITIPDIQLPQPPAAEFSAESYTVETNLLGETVLYVNINYTNKAETPECFLTSFQISVQQDDKACLMTAGNPAQENHLMDQVQPDETALISEAFIISPEKEAAVSVNAYFSDDTYLEQSILPHADGTVSVIQ